MDRRTELLSRGEATRARLRKASSARGPAPKVKPSPLMPPLVEIVSIGREILKGQCVDTNAHEIASYLSQRGARVRRITTVDDSVRAIASAITESLGRGARLVVTTGGLGPTADDRTLSAVADALRLPLAIHAHAKEMVEGAYGRLHQQGLVPKGGLNLAREKMCAVPVGSEPIANLVGTAPGVIVRLPGGAAVLSLPGVPAEMRSVLETAVPRLRELAQRGAVARRDVETPTTDESSLRSLLDHLAEEFPAVWVKSHAPGFEEKGAHVRVTLEAEAPTRKEAESLVEDALRRLLSLAASG